MKRKIMIIRSSLILCTILLLSVTNASSPVKVDADLEEMREHNKTILKVIQHELSGDRITETKVKKG